ncbi:MAG TPA: hypothetical protein VNP92_07430 [Actinophytocola sp.]|nr:hypothetical protein [Actinophytocola sp.]
MRGATRVVIVGLLSLFLALPTVTAAADPFLQQPPPPTSTAPSTTTPSGPRLEPAETEADQAEDRRKIVMGVASVVLIGLVIWGRSIRSKRKKKAEGG